jgi:hypothetical protein
MSVREWILLSVAIVTDVIAACARSMAAARERGRRHPTLSAA